MAYAKIHIENLGPIREGSFELRPLTIFIGPNNSGKTYAATAAYAMVNGLIFNHRTVFDSMFQSSDQTATIRQRVVGDLFSSLSNAFAVSDVNEVRSRTESAEHLAIDIADPDESLPAIEVRSSAEMTQAPTVLPRVRPSQWPSDQPSFTGDASIRLPRSVDEPSMQAWRDELERIGLPTREAMYLPAGRHGLVESLPLLATLSIGLLRQDMSQTRHEVQSLPGVIADFITKLLGHNLGYVRTEYPLVFQTAATLLEQRILGGVVERAEARIGLTELVYRYGDNAVPLERASSMVGDLASLALWMKEQLAPGNVLIVDEPEAHLHPANERRIARVLARLSRAGVRVIVPTHSSTIVHQVSNMVQSRLLSASERASLGISEDDVLSPDDVALYQFVPERDGVVIREIEYDPEFGYPEEGFYEVAESISDESFEIESRLPVPVQ